MISRGGVPAAAAVLLLLGAGCSRGPVELGAVVSHEDIRLTGICTEAADLSPSTVVAFDRQPC